MKSYDDPPDHSLGSGDCLRCECHESRHTEPGGGCDACDCRSFVGAREPCCDEPEHGEAVDGPCEYERLGGRE